jgi:hypothetical protein
MVVLRAQEPFEVDRWTGVVDDPLVGERGWRASVQAQDASDSDAQRALESSAM